MVSTGRSYLALLALVLTFCLQSLPVLAWTAPPRAQQIRSVSGRNINEKKVEWIWSVLPVTVKACRALPACQMTAAEKTVLDKMIANLGYYDEQSLQFESESQNPGRFTSDQNEAHRIAVTGNIPQAKIFVNTDRMNALSQSQLMAILGHEIAHHVGLVDDSARVPDQIGAKLGHYFEVNSVSSDLEEYGHPEIQAVYFGIGVPDTNEYFQIFPVPTVHQDAKVALFDSENVFDLASFDPFNSMNCRTVPGSVPVNQQVSDPVIRTSRWFSGDKEIYLNFNVHIQNVCLITAHAPDADMKGIGWIGQMNVPLKLEHPDIGAWKDSPLKIRGDFIRAVLRPRANQETPEAVNMARLERVVSAPSTVKAGETYKVQVLIRYNGVLATSECQAPFKSDSWHTMDLLGAVPPAPTDRCHIEKQQGDLYLASFEKDIPANVFPGNYTVDALGMVPTGSDAEITAMFSTALKVEVLNPQPPPALKVLSAQFVGLGQNKLVGDKSYDFEVKIENAEAIYMGYVSGRMVEQGEYTWDFMGDLLVDRPGHSDTSIFKSVTYRKEGNVLVATYKVILPGASVGAHLQRLELYSFYFISTNLAETFVDHRSAPMIYQVQ